MFARSNVLGKANKQQKPVSSFQPHPFAGTLSQKATKFSLPWVRDDQKKTSGGRGSSINIEELAKPLEQGDRPFSNRTNFKYQKAPVVIPFISLKNFKKTNENLVASQPETEKSKLKKQQSDLISHLTSPQGQQEGINISPPPPNAPKQQEEEDDVSDLLEELETVKVKYQEGLKKKIENEAIANAKRSHEQKLTRNTNKRDSRHSGRRSGGDRKEEIILKEWQNRLEMGDMTMFFDDSLQKMAQQMTGVENAVMSLDEKDARLLEEEFEENFLPELREMHKEELYRCHLALKSVVKEKEKLGRRSLKQKRLRDRSREKKKAWMQEEISHSLAELKENGFISAEGLKKDARYIISSKYGEDKCVFAADFIPFYDEIALGVSLSPTISLRRKVATLVYATIQFYAFTLENPDYDNALELKRDAEKRQERIDEFIKEAPILHDVALHFEKTGRLEFPADGSEVVTTKKGKKGQQLEDPFAQLQQ